MAANLTFNPLLSPERDLTTGVLYNFLNQCLILSLLFDKTAIDVGTEPVISPKWSILHYEIHLVGIT